MRYIIIAIAIMLLAGCDTARRVNPGAKEPIIAMSPLQLQAEWAKRGSATVPMGQQIYGLFDGKTGEILVDGTQDKDRYAARILHEFGHRVEHVFPAIWVFIYAYDSPKFPTRSTMHP